jgi:hypothetical protein
VTEDGTNADRLDVYVVTGTTTAVDGRVLVEFGKSSFEGYQTDEGVYLVSSRAPTADKVGIVVELHAVARAAKLSSRNGLYMLGTRTEFWSGRKATGNFTDWVGEAAVMVANDSIHVDLYLKNDAGGTSYAYFTGPLGADGRFALRDPTHELTGRLASGRFMAEWIDRRIDSGSFRGTMQGRRE